MTIPTPQTTPNPIPNDYYDLNQCSGEWHNWSVSKISCQTWYLIPVGLVGVIASTALRLVEGTFMLLANACLAIKYLCFARPSQPIATVEPVVPQQPPVIPATINRPPIPQQPLPPLPNNQPPILSQLSIQASSNPQLLLRPPSSPAPLGQPEPTRGCTTRAQARVATGFAAIKENPKPAIAAATGLFAAGVSFACPPLMPLAIGMATYKLAEMHFTKK